MRKSVLMKKQKKVKEIEYEALVRALFWRCDSYQRLPALIVQAEAYGTDSYWYKALGEIWTSCDNVGQFSDFIREALGGNGAIPEMMDEEELSFLDKLPDELTIYRGAGEDGDGICWSLSKEIASRFPFLGRYFRDDPHIHTATVKKVNIIAVKLGRNEQEIITAQANIIKSEKITEPQDLIDKKNDVLEIKSKSSNLV